MQRQQTLMSDSPQAQAAAPRHILAVGEATLATLIWASSFVLVKLVLPFMGPLTVAALRYFLAFLLLLPFLLWRARGKAFRLAPPVWLRLFMLGLTAYAIGNGALFWGLKHVPATTASALMSGSPILILFASIFWLKEIPTRRQLLGVVVAIMGSGLFFSPGLAPGEPLGIAIVLLGVVGFSAFGVLGRDLARGGEMDTLARTTIPLGFGGLLLLAGALGVEGLPRFNPLAWAIVLWLAVVNTAAGYWLYNDALRTVTALQMNVVLNLSPLVTAFLAWLLLGETLHLIQILGMVIVIGGVVLVESSRPRSQDRGEKLGRDEDRGAEGFERSASE